MGQTLASEDTPSSGHLDRMTGASQRLGKLLALSFASLILFQDGLAAQELGVIDISHCTTETGFISTDLVREWIDVHGVQHIIVRGAIAEERGGTCQAGEFLRPIAKQQLETLGLAMQEGLAFGVDLYLFVHWPGGSSGIKTPIREQVRESIALLDELEIGSPLPVGRLWIDLEEAPPSGQSRLETIGHIRDALDECGFFPCGIYTSKGWWEDADYTGNTTEFSTYPLWYAHYPTEPNLDEWGSFGFGGWPEPVGKQYDRGHLAGASVDFNIMYLGDLDGLGTPSWQLPPKGTAFDPDKPLSINLSWEPISGNPNHGPVTYQVNVNYLNFDLEFSESTSVLRFFLSTPNVHYRWRVRAHNHYGAATSTCPTPPDCAASTITWGEKPDLRVTDINFTPSHLFEGLRTTAIAELTNVGASHTGGFNVKWYLDGVQVGYGSHRSLAPGEVSVDNIRFDWTVPQGEHTLRFEADADDHVSETNEGNNNFWKDVVIFDFDTDHPPKADLVVTRIHFSSQPQAGLGTTATAELVNGGGVASGPFDVQWLLDGTEALSGNHGSLGPGELSDDGTVRFDWIPTPGEHRLKFSADVGDTVDEMSELDNSFEVVVDVPEPAPPPDLEVRGITFVSTPTAGVETTAIAELVNSGGLPSGFIKVRWLLDGVQAGFGSHSSLPPEELSAGNFWPLSWTPTPGEHTLSFSADVDNAVEESDETNNSFEVTLDISTPPTADAGPDLTLDCAGKTGTKVTLDGSGSSDPDGDSLSFEWRDADGSLIGTTATIEVSLPLGTHEFTLTVDDGEGGTDTDSVVITIQDETPPGIDQLTASPSSLWPPNHAMVPVRISAFASDVCDGAFHCRITSVRSNEPTNGSGDGDTAPDWRILGDLRLELRAERSGKGSGRVYTIEVTCEDGSGNASSKNVTVKVPHSAR